MEDGATIGSVVPKGGGIFEWIIREFSELTRRGNAFFNSPYFFAECETWHLQIRPNGLNRHTQIQITLWRKSTLTGKSVSCTVGVKRLDQSKKKICTKTAPAYAVGTRFIFKKTRKQIREEGVWLRGCELTVTCLIGDESKAKRKLTSHENLTGGKIRKIKKLEDCRSAAFRGVAQVIKDMRELLTEDNQDYDLRLVVKGREFRAHKLILKARCPVFRMMLTHDSKEKNSGEIVIEDCDPECFGEFLLFLYSGVADNLDTSKALGLYYAADKYDQPLLKEQCVTFLKTSLCTTSVCDVVLLATKHGEQELLRTATKYFSKNIKQILLTVEWQNFMAENPTAANELLIKAL